MSKPFQDWEEVVWKKPTKKSKSAAGSPTVSKEIRNLEEDDIPVLNKISIEQRQQLIEARNAKNFTQKDLAKLINIDSSIINSYENGTVANFNKVFYKKLMRVLGVNSLL